MLYMAKGRDQAGSFQRHYLGQPNYHLCHISWGREDQVNNGVGGERPEETDRLGVGRGGKQQCSGTGQGQGQSPRVKLRPAEQAALGSLYKWLLCQEGTSALTSVRERVARLQTDRADSPFASPPGG